MNNSISRMDCRLIALAGLVVALGLGMHPTQAWSAIDCAQVLSAGDTGRDSDGTGGDGLTDFQECSGIPLADGSKISSCAAGTTDRTACLDPNAKDIFVIYAPQTSGSLLSKLPKSPFDPNPFNEALPSLFGIAFHGLAPLGVTAHQVTPSQINSDRTITPVQKAVKVTESLDTSSTILGNCQWGTPNGLDGCAVYSQRTLDFMTKTCTDSTGRLMSVYQPNGTLSDIPSVFNAYMTYLFIHETGHSLGGLTATYDSRFGGYHYKPGAGLTMEQAVTYSTKGGKCTFYISPVWNATLDPPAVKLK